MTTQIGLSADLDHQEDWEHVPPDPSCFDGLSDLYDAVQELQGYDPARHTYAEILIEELAFLLLNKAELVAWFDDEDYGSPPTIAELIQGVVTWHGANTSWN